MTLQRPRDPETRAHEREIADYTHDYTVVLIHDPDDSESETVLGELDETFSNDVDASYAANDAAVPDVNIRAEVRTVRSDSDHGTVVHTSE